MNRSFQSTSNSEYPLDTGCVHVWNIKIDFNELKLADYISTLAIDEKERANKFKFEKDKIVYTAARGMLRKLSGKYLNLKPEDVEFGYGKFEKPFYSSETTINFNISHSGGRIVIAFCKDAKLGIDIEKIKKDFDVMDIAQNFFSEREIKALSEITDVEKQKAFYRCWTRKESFIKAKGSGLSFPLDSFSVSLDNDTHAELLETKWDIKEKDQWNMYSFVPAKNYIGALTVKGDIRNVEHYEYDSIIAPFKFAK